MNWYRDHEDAWRQIIETVAAEERRSTQMVEKDTLQSMFLLGLSKSELPFIFKGGTSLSKAYDLIDRFSEDIDLSADRKLSEIERRRTKNTILETADHQDITDRLWQHQHSQHRYDTGTDGNRHVEGKRK